MFNTEMIARPLLSICIPTFNRLNYLKDLLAALLPQAELSGVEVCVSDNHSTDGTAQFLADLAKHGSPVLKYVVQPENIGLDRNMLAVIRIGSGHYTYPLGDDDMLPDDTLQSILKEIENGYDLLVLNGWHTNATLEPIKKHLSIDVGGSLFRQPDQAFKILWDKMPFGSFIALRELFGSDCFERFLGTSHAYTGAVWESLADVAKKKGSCTVKCMAAPTVLLRGAEKTWRNNAAQIMLHEIPIWFDLIADNDTYKKLVPRIKKGYLRRQTSLRSLARYRVNGQLEKVDASRLCSRLNKTQGLKIILVATTPTPIVQKFLVFHDSIRTYFNRTIAGIRVR